MKASCQKYPDKIVKKLCGYYCILTTVIPGLLVGGWELSFSTTHTHTIIMTRVGFTNTCVH